MVPWRDRAHQPYKKLLRFSRRVLSNCSALGRLSRRCARWRVASTWRSSRATYAPQRAASCTIWSASASLRPRVLNVLKHYAGGEDCCAPEPRPMRANTTEADRALETGTGWPRLLEHCRRRGLSHWPRGCKLPVFFCGNGLASGISRNGHLWVPPD